MRYIVTVKERVPTGDHDSRTAKTKLVHVNTQEYTSEEMALIAVKVVVKAGRVAIIEAREE
jgi:hypothetical protein